MIRSGAPKHKICRRAGFCLWNSRNCPSYNRPYQPGQHGQRRRKQSDYARILFEKQKLRYTYNVTEKQFRNMFEKAKAQSGVTAENLLRLLESRLDTVVFRSRLAASPFQARQLVSHGHFTVDGERVNIPSMHLKPGQTVQVRDRSRQHEWAFVGADQMNQVSLTYLDVNPDALAVTLKALPNIDEVPLGDIDVQQTVAFYSRV